MGGAIEETTDRLFVQVLGRPRVLRAGEPVELRARKPLALLYILGVHGSDVSRQLASELLWGPGGRNNLRTALHTLKRGGLEGAIAAHGDMLRCVASSDLRRFKNLLREGRELDALRLCRAPGTSNVPSMLLEGLEHSLTGAFDDWLNVERKRVAALYADCLRAVARRLVRSGDMARALALFRELLALDPIDESAHRQVMELEWRRGNPRAAVEQFETCRRTLAEELGLEPLPPTVRLFDTIRLEDWCHAPATESRGGQWIIGRSRELANLRRLLSTSRLTTVLGPEGIGKTTLARALLTAWRRDGNQDAHFVSLAPLVDGELAPIAIANEIHAPFDRATAPVDQLCRSLRDRRVLVVLDNVDHVDIRGTIEMLLERVPELRILVTSCRSVGLSREVQFRIGGLSYPLGPFDPQDADARASWRRCDAVLLFLRAARKIDPHFTLADRDVLHVAKVCRTLGGHPLRIVLAAGWLRLYSPRRLADAVGRDLLQLDNLGTMASERHVRHAPGPGTVAFAHLSTGERASVRRPCSSTKLHDKQFAWESNLFVNPGEDHGN